MINFYKHFVCVLLISIVSIASGQSMQDLQKLKSEYEKYQKGQPLLQPQELGVDNDREEAGLPKKATIQPYIFKDTSSELKDDKLPFYGYDFFTKRDTLSFWENLPSPSNYYLGPGDELVVSLWGETQLRKTYIISRDGKIYDDKVGLLTLSGKTIESSKKYLILQFARIYATLSNSNPSTFMDVSLGQLRSINVNFVGEVKYPGIYPIHPFSTVITGLIQAGGVDTTGSLRNIKINRNNQEILTVDLYDYLLNGKLPENIQLRDQDVVLIPPRLSTISIDSAILRPGIYESIPGESIKQLIKYAGGLKFNSSNKIAIKRISPFELRSIGNQTIENYYIDYSNSNLTAVQDGDMLTIQEIFINNNEVEIIGQVKRPGVYYYSSGMMLSDLINLSGGFKDTTFLKSVYQYRGELVRRNPETRYESVIEVNIKNMINDVKTEDQRLQNLDRFVVHANLNFFEKENVQIFGEVNIPGSYPLTSDNETLRSLIYRAGNLTTKALDNGIAIFRSKKYFDKPYEIQKSLEFINTDQSISRVAQKVTEIPEFDDRIRVAWRNDSITLMPGDSIIVKEATKTINIYGEVYNPGLIEYRKGKSIRYYVNSAGGVTNDGTTEDIIIVYSNGLISPKKWYSSPKVEDGATIIVNKKEQKEIFDLTQFATNWTSIISSMITAIILSQQLGPS